MNINVSAKQIFNRDSLSGQVKSIWFRLLKMLQKHVFWVIISLSNSCGTVALYGPFFFLADFRATDFTLFGTSSTCLIEIEINSVTTSIPATCASSVRVSFQSINVLPQAQQSRRMKKLTKNFNQIKQSTQ